MPDFRTQSPVRRPIVTPVNHYGEHKPDLKLDFLERCGWCNAHDGWKTTYFEVDHFIPKKILPIIRYTEYGNLIYSCRSCNNAKRSKWPTKDITVANANDEGFVDPASDTYNSHFERSADGEIIALSSLGQWMHVALKLDKPQHKVIYILEELEPLIEILTKMDKSALPDALKNQIFSLYDNYFKYFNQWRQL